MNKKIFTLLIILLSFACANADNGSNSPYSRYGIGLLSDQSLGVNRQMGGLGYGLYSRTRKDSIGSARHTEQRVTRSKDSGNITQDIIQQDCEVWTITAPGTH